MTAPTAPDLCAPLAKYLRTDLPGLSPEEAGKRDEACHIWTGFKSWNALYEAWLLCAPYWGLVKSDPRNYRAILECFISKTVPEATHCRTRSPLDEFILTWAYERTSIHLSLLATLIKMSWYVSSFSCIVGRLFSH